MAPASAVRCAAVASLALGTAALNLADGAHGGGQAGTLAGARAGPADIIPDDLWAVHDLLLAGYTAPFMKEGAGKQEARQSAVKLARLLPQVHPHGPCRARIGAALEGWDPVAEPERRAGVTAAAREAWACLPGNFTEASFSTPYTEEAIDSLAKAQWARMPSVKQRLGACEGSQWPRTCSYWSAMHTMAHRADQLELGAQFLGAVMPILAGGAPCT